ncbi:MAG TPA: nucleotidyltransferase domain-containing protein [Gemmatimonadaceae bacterium]
MKDPRLVAEVAAHPFPLLFATVSGAHLYGFPSPDSDFDLRGTHIAPNVLLTGLDRIDETIKSSHVREGMEVDLVTHEVRKFFMLLLRDNGYVLEQLYSPLVVHASAMHEELKVIARGCITRRCVRHYLGFAENQWLLFEKDEPHRLKPLLYTFRVLLSGLHLMRTGEVNANLPNCNAAMDAERLTWVDELIARKQHGTERGTLSQPDLTFYHGEYLRLRERLTMEAERSALPEAATAKSALQDLLRRIREGAKLG